jgi:hypothetical protein
MANIVKFKVLSEQKSSMAPALKNTILSVVYTGQSCSLVASAVRIGVQMGKISKLGWLMG